MDKKNMGEIGKYFDRHQSLILFLFFSLGYFFWRYTGFDYLVWDDTSSASYNVFVNNSYYSLAKDGFLSWMLKDVFANIQGDGYRPFIAFIKRIGIGYFTDPSKNTIYWVLFNSIVTGVFAVVYYHFSKRFVKTKKASLLSLCLILFSTPFLTAGLIVYSGFHLIIPLIICCGFFCYYNLVEQEKNKVLWAVGLIVIMLIGPLFREYLSIFPLLIIFLELLRKRQFAWIVGISCLFFIHALFPTIWIKILLFHDIPIRPIYAMGNLGSYLKTGTEGLSLLHILWSLHWRIFIDILSIYPTSIFILSLVAFVLNYKNKKFPFIMEKDSLFLLVFFTVSFLPFLKAFNEQVHLAYCMVPLSILLAKAIEKLWFMVAQTKKMVKFFKSVLGVLIAVILLDQALNVYSVRKVTTDMYKGIALAADWFVQEVPKGTPVITNAHHLEDIRFYSNGHIEPWGAPGGIPDQRKWMYNPSDLQKLIDKSSQQGLDVYFFDVEIKETPGQRGLGRRLFYVRDKNVEMEDLGILHTMQSRYPFLDPIKHFIPLGQVTWPGPPDLEFDFYRGPALDGSLFFREVFARYHMYKVTGKKVIMNSADPKLLEENVYGFNLILYHSRVYAIPQPEGAFEIARIERGDYSISFQGKTAAIVKEKIEQFVNRSEEEKIVDNDSSNEQVLNNVSEISDRFPELIEENFYGFNLVSYRSLIYAIPQSEGAFEQGRVDRGGYSKAFQGQTADIVKDFIRGFVSSKENMMYQNNSSVPILVENGYRGFNIISLRGNFYAILQIEGSFHVQRFINGEYSPSFIGKSVAQVKQDIDKAKSSSFVSLKIFIKQKMNGFVSRFK